MRYIVAFLIAIGLIILFVILLLRAIFSGGESPQERRFNLADYERTNVVMRVMIDGPVNANEVHEQAHIQVGKDGNEIKLVRGYQGEVTKQENVASNSSAYGNFLRAIDLLGYNHGDKRKDLEDYRGHCPFGNRYVFQIVEGDDIKQQFWSTSCGDDSGGSFRGQADQIVELFQAQIPNYQDLTQELGL